MKRKSGLERAAAVTGVMGIVGGMLFLSANITGNVVSDASVNSANWMGGILFIIGLVGAFVYFKKK
jgi:hypothetical protein